MTRLTAEDVERKSARNRAARSDPHKQMIAKITREQGLMDGTIKPVKPTKYRAIRTVVDGITFASKKEAARYVELKLAQKAGEITDLKLQPKIVLNAGGMHICDYVADFFYYDRVKKTLVHEDCKGFRTSTYRLKKKLVKALANIDILET